MELTWINVVDSAVKIGLGALISAVSAYLMFMKSQSQKNNREDKARYYELQGQKKTTYVEFLSQSQKLIQSHLYKDSRPDSDEYTDYLRTFNEVQIISSDDIRLAAHNIMSDVSAFIFLRKNDQETSLIDNMVRSAREKVTIFQKVAQTEVTRSYQKT